MLLAVAPNGARKQYVDHTALPITPSELAATAESCLAAGAGMMHVHVRDNNLQHTIDADLYTEAFAAIRAIVGDDVFLQATTEAVGKFNPDEQMAMVKALAAKQTVAANGRVFGVSLAVRELLSDLVSYDTINAFFELLRRNNILPQLIMYDEADRNRFQSLLESGVLPGRSYPCLFVLGRYNAGLTSEPAELLPFMSDLTGVSSWMACAFGANEYNVAKTAALLGGHMRIGFENNTWLADGSIATNNAVLIAQTATQLEDLGRQTATTEEIIALMTPDW